MCSISQNGDAMLEAACKMDMEGIISSGRCAIHVRRLILDQIEVPRQAGGRDRRLARCQHMRSLMVGTHQDGKFVYMGRVGTGYTASVAADLLRKLKPLRRKTAAFANPPRAPDLNWVEPKLVAEVEYENVTSDGIFRQAAFKGLRADKSAASVVPEVPVDAPTKEKKSMAKKIAKAAAKGGRRAAAGDDVVLGVKISHSGKELWPKSAKGPAVTKLDLARYMEAAAEKMPAWPTAPSPCARPMASRQTSISHALKGTQAPVLAIKVRASRTSFLGVDTAAALVALAQQGVTEIHPWGSKPGKPDEPERVIFDLDPRRMCRSSG